MKEVKVLSNNRFYLTDGGLETDLIFNKGIELPHFAAFPLIEHPNHSKIVESYYREYMEIAKNEKKGFILESPTWRANTDWGYALGYDQNELFRINQLAINQLKSLKNEYEDDIEEILISGCIGPRGDGYVLSKKMTPEEAEAYHLLQVKAFKECGADLVTALTMTYIDEALGLTIAAMKSHIPVVISFTVETDGDLPSRESIQEAISTIDAITNAYPSYYMINCAHPSHFYEKLDRSSHWNSRIRGVRANASCKSHAELDESTELDAGNKTDLSDWYQKLLHQLPNLMVVGGCCGTDASHINSICNQLNCQSTCHSNQLKELSRGYR